MGDRFAFFAFDTLLIETPQHGATMIAEYQSCERSHFESVGHVDFEAFFHRHCGGMR